MYLHDSLQHFLWIGVEQPVNIMAAGGRDLLHGDTRENNSESALASLLIPPLTPTTHTLSSQDWSGARQIRHPRKALPNYTTGQQALGYSRQAVNSSRARDGCMPLNNFIIEWWGLSRTFRTTHYVRYTT